MSLVRKFVRSVDAHPQQAQRWARVIISLAMIIVVWQGVRIATRTSGDFHLHWELGRRMYAGEFIYQLGPDELDQPCGLDCPYPPFWALAHVPLSFLPERVAQCAIYPLFVVSFLLLLHSLRQLTHGQLRVSGVVQLWVAIVATALASRYLVRDMLECGVNLALVALSWYSVVLWQKQKWVKSGCVLGFATALKCTPALFIAWWIWKRQWKLATIAVLFTVMFSLSPIVLMGVDDYLFTMEAWLGHVKDGLMTSDPTQGALGEEPFNNMSLRPALARFLVTVPAGHQLRYEHPLTFDLGNLSPQAAGWVIRIVFILILATVGTVCRQSAKACSSLVLAWECSIASVLILLFSPITWGQHCVGVLPFLYLFVRSAYAGVKLPTVACIAVWVHGIVTLLLNRGVIGEEYVWLLDSYHLPTWSMLLLVFAALACRQQVYREQLMSSATTPIVK